MVVERMMSLAELSELLGVPLSTLYGWRHRGEGPPGYRWASTCAFDGPMSTRGWQRRPTLHRRVADHGLYRAARSCGERDRPAASARSCGTRSGTAIMPVASTVRRGGAWWMLSAVRPSSRCSWRRDRGVILVAATFELSAWASEWVPTRHDLRATTLARLETTMSGQVLPRFGTTPLVKITNAEVRRWVAELLAAEACRRPPCGRLCSRCVSVSRLRWLTAGSLMNPALDVPLPSERLKPPRFLSQDEVELLAESMPDRYRALVLVGAYAGLRWGEAAGLTRANVDVLRSAVRVMSTAVEVRGHVTLGNEPKTRRSRRTIPLARSVMRRIERHLAEYVGPERDALVFTAPQGGPLRRSLFARRAWGPAVERAGLRTDHVPWAAAQLRRDPGGGRLQRAGGVGVGRTQQRRVHPDPLWRALRGRLGRRR